MAELKIISTKYKTLLFFLSDYTALGVFVLAPLTYGSVDNLWIAIWCSLLASSIVILKPAEIGKRSFYLIISVLLSVLIIVVIAILQSSVVVPLGLGDPGWSAAANLLKSDLSYPNVFAERLSITRYGPLYALGPTLLFGLAFLRSFLFCQSRVHARILLITLTAAGAIYGLVSIAIFIAHPSINFTRASVNYARDLTGPFINRNTAAVYWGTCSLISFIRFAQITGRHFDGVVSLAGFYYRLQTRPPADLTFFGGAFLICFAAVLMTASRSVIFLTTAILLLVALWHYQSNSRPRPLFYFLAAAIIAIALLLAAGSGEVAQRIQHAGFADHFRWAAYQATFSMISEHPWFGVGLGNFEAAFPGYRTTALGTYGIWDHAHSTPLELAAELGIPAALAIATVWVAIGLAILRVALRHGPASHYSLVALCVGLLGTLHSLIDFSLQIPGYAVVFAATIACGLAQNNPSSRTRRTNRKQSVPFQ